MDSTDFETKPEIKTLLITGATGGLGQALCEAFANKGNRICLHTHQQWEKAELLAKRLRLQGCETLVVQANLGEQKAVDQLFASLEKKWDTLDLLINNAGVTQNKLFQNTRPTDWDEVFQVNLTAPFFCMQAAARVMLPRKQGHIINIASHAALLGRSGQASYAASKNALLNLTQSAAREWGPQGLQVNAICPGFLPSGMTESLNDKQKTVLLRDNLLQRFSTPEEVTQFIVYLSEMKHVSGQVFKLDSRVT